MGRVGKLSPIKKLVFTVVLLLAALVLANVVAFAVEWLPYGTHQVMGSPAGLYRSASPGTRPQLQPGARIKGLLYEISINSLGFRGPELTSPRPPNALRVWCVGGSSTFDIFVPDNESSWPARLQVLLQRALPRRAVEVINAGIPGEVLYGSIMDFERHFPAVRPDVLVIYHGPNDIRNQLGKEMKPPGTVVHVLSRFALFRVLQRQLDRRTAPHGDYTGRSLTAPKLDRVTHEVLRMVETAQRRGIKVVLASHGLRLSQQPTVSEAEDSLAVDSDLLALPPLEVSRAFDAYNSTVQRLALGRHAAFADVRRAVPADSRYWGDATHFSAEGAKLAARAISKAVLKAVGSE